MRQTDSCIMLSRQMAVQEHQILMQIYGKDSALLISTLQVIGDVPADGTSSRLLISSQKWIKQTFPQIQHIQLTIPEFKAI